MGRFTSSGGTTGGTTVPVPPTSASPLGGVNVGNIVLNQDTANGRISIPNTNPNGWNTDAGRMTVDFELTPVNYFSANPGGHFAIVLRNTSTLISSAVRGQGFVIGNATGYQYPSDMNPTPMIETWMNSVTGAPGDNYLWNNSDGARSLQVKDNTKYKFIVDAVKTNEGNRYIRYRMWSKNSTNKSWRAEVDTGDVLDHNIWADLTQTGLVFGHVFGSNLSTWSLLIENCNVTWGPAEASTPDQTIKLSRFGAELEGDLRLIGDSRKIKIESDPTKAVTAWSSIQANVVNSDTTVLALPNGSSTKSSFAVVNNANLASAYQMATMSINSSNAVIETSGVNLTDPSFGINVGINNRVGTFTKEGINLSTTSIANGAAVVLKAGDAIALEATKNIKLKFNSTNNLLEFFNGTTRRGYIDMATGVDTTFGASGVSTLAWTAVTGKPTTVAGYGITDVPAAVTSLPFSAITSKPTTLAGYGITDAANGMTGNAPIAAGIGTKISYDTKGLVTSSSQLTAGDIPSLDWSKITTGKPTTLAGYGITDGSSGPTSVSWISILNKPTTLAGYGITDGGGTPAWTAITGKPTTLAGYGISDAVTKNAAISWSPLSLLNGWGEYAPGTTFSPAVSIDQLGVVRLRGIAYGGPSEVLMCMLPFQYRPSRYSIYPINSGVTNGIIQIRSTGEVYINWMNPTGNNFVGCLDGIEFLIN